MAPARRPDEWDDVWRYQGANLTLLCLRCAGTSGRTAWNTLLDTKLSVWGYGVVDPRIRGAHRVRARVLSFRATPRLGLLTLGGGARNRPIEVPRCATWPCRGTSST